MTKKVKYEMNAEVVIACSDEAGAVIGRAEYITSETDYLVRYVAKDGRAVEQWWKESALTSVTA